MFETFDFLHISFQSLMSLKSLTALVLKFRSNLRETSYCILSSILSTFYIENDAEIFPAHYTWKVAGKGFKMAFMMNKLAMINSREIILEK